MVVVMHLTEGDKVVSLVPQKANAFRLLRPLDDLKVGDVVAADSFSEARKRQLLDQRYLEPVAIFRKDPDDLDVHARGS